MSSIPDQVVVSGGHAVTFAGLAMAENRWFQVVVSGDPVVFFGDDSPTAPAGPGESPAVVAVQLDGTASAAEFGDWTVERLSVFCAEPRHSLSYAAHPEAVQDGRLPYDYLAPPEPATEMAWAPYDLPRGPVGDLTDAPQGLRDVVAYLVAYEPAAASTRPGDVLTDPGLLRDPLTARLARSLYAVGGSAAVPDRADLEDIVDAVVTVVVAALPARPVRFHMPAPATAPTDATPSDASPAAGVGGAGVDGADVDGANVGPVNGRARRDLLKW